MLKQETLKQRVKRIIKHTEREMLGTIEQDLRLITTLKTQRDSLLDACEAIDRAWVGDGIDMVTAVDICLVAIKEAKQG